MTQFILSNSKFNDNAAHGCHVLREFFTSKKLKNDIDNLPLNILSENFKNTSIFLYDNPILLSKYPNGLVTETLILLPVEKFQSIRENFTTIFKDKKFNFQLMNNSTLWGLTLSNSLIKNLELKLDIHLPEEESNHILNHVLSNIKEFKNDYQNLYDINSFKEFDLNLASVKNKDLLNVLEKEDLLIVSVIKKCLDSSKEDIISFKQWLSQSPALYQNLPTIKKSITDLSFEEIKYSTLSDLNQSIKSHTNYECSIFQPLLKMTQLIDQIKKDSNNDFDLLINNFKKDLFPSLFSANDYLFDCSLHYLRDSIFPSSFPENQDNIENFCHSCSDFYNTYQRESVIKKMTYFDMLDDLSFIDNKEVLDKKINEKNNNNSLVTNFPKKNK